MRLDRLKLTFINRICASALTILVIGSGKIAYAEQLSCESVFQSQTQISSRPRNPDTPGSYSNAEQLKQELAEVTNLLRQAGFSEYEVGQKGLEKLTHTVKYHPTIFQYQIARVKELEASLKPQNPAQLVRTIERLGLAARKECRGGNCTTAVMEKEFCTGGNCSTRLINGNLITGKEQLLFQYQATITLFEQPMKVWVAEPVMIDNLSNALTPYGMGIRALNDIIQAAQRRNQPTTVLFIDVNDLNKVNYFLNGYSDGDAYIRAVGRVIKNSLRMGDTFIRQGGDEFILILDHLSASEIQLLSQRLIHAIANDPEALAVFNNQWAFIEGTMNEIHSAQRWDDLSDEAMGLVTALQDELKQKANQQNRVSTTFAEFQADVLELLRISLTKQRTVLAPTISVGSTVIRKGDSLESVIQRSSCNANLCKKLYKEALGADARKYGGAPENENLIFANARSGTRPLPQAFPPDQVRVKLPSEEPKAKPKRQSLEDFYR